MVKVMIKCMIMNYSVWQSSCGWRWRWWQSSWWWRWQRSQIMMTEMVIIIIIIIIIITKDRYSRYVLRVPFLKPPGFLSFFRFSAAEIPGWTSLDKRMHLGLDCLLGERIIQNGMLDVKGGHLSSDWPSQNERLDFQKLLYQISRFCRFRVGKLT